MPGRFPPPTLCHPDCREGFGWGLNVPRPTSISIASLPSWREMRLHLPSGLPTELEKSLSSCRRQRDALREALKEFRGIWEGIQGFGENSEAFREEKEVGQGKAAAGTAPRSPPHLLPKRGGDPKRSRKGGDFPAQGKRSPFFWSPLLRPPPPTCPAFPPAKTTPEPGAAPPPQLLADRKSVRWDEERDEAGESRRDQEPAGGCEGLTPGRCRRRSR